ncbi:hypothetical protein ACOMHN_018468 [Nucella lapillus]
MWITVKNYNPPERRLDVVGLSSMTGFVQSPGFNPESMIHHPLGPPSMKATLTIPASHVVMLSDLHAEIDLTSKLSLYSFNQGKRLLLWTILGFQFFPLPEVYNHSEELHFLFEASMNPDGIPRYNALEYEPPSTPEKLQDGRWNCSVSFWRHFQPHLACNLRSQCSESEDEQLCEYRPCDPEGFQMNDRCYVLVTPKGSLTHAQAEEGCRDLGGHLVALNSVPEAEALKEVLWARSRKFDFYVGLTYASATLHSMWHWTFTFLACDVDSHCWAGNDVTAPAWDSPASSWCEAPVTSFPLYFVCEEVNQRVPFTLVCDAHADCFDGSDEDFCTYRQCPLEAYMQCGNSGQCFSSLEWCNLERNCLNFADEKGCVPDVKSVFERSAGRLHSDDYWQFKPPQPPAVVDFVTWLYGKAYITPLSTSGEEGHASDITKCPETHFQCPSDGYCLPVFVLCNGVSDCPGQEDETDCEQFTCSGFYRCRGSAVCLHPDHVCDGFLHCPQQDDERFCDHTCPTSCTCQGLSFHCRREVRIENYANVRYLDASRSGLSPERLGGNTMLVFLALQHCQLVSLNLPQLPNLVILDLSENKIHTVTINDLKQVKNLKVLLLSGNSLTGVFEGNRSSGSDHLHSLHILHLSRVPLHHLNTQVLNPLPSLTTLNLSYSSVQRVTGSLPTPQLQTLDLTGCRLHHYPPRWLTSLPSLQSVRTDVPTLCCAQNLPAGFNPNLCHSPPSLLSSCQHLLGLPSLRALTAILAGLALLGNGLNLVFQLRGMYVEGEHNRGGGGGAFISQLSVSNLGIGAYLLGVCVADQVYQGGYLWVDRWWRDSLWCSLFSFLYLSSVQVSALIVVSLALYHCLHLARQDLRQCGRTQVMASSVFCWVTGLILSMVQHLSSWLPHRQTSLCVPLPSTLTPAAQHHASHVLIIMNTSLMTLVIAAQVFIYIIIRKNPVVFLTDSRRCKQLNSARRVVNVSVTDACAWFVVTGVIFLLPKQLLEEIRSAVAAFVLPVKAALNPVLHVANVALERRRHAQTQRVLQRLGNKAKNKQKHKQ